MGQGISNYSLHCVNLNGIEWREGVEGAKRIKIEKLKGQQYKEEYDWVLGSMRAQWDKVSKVEKM